jgi:hypothetical protein
MDDTLALGLPSLCRRDVFTVGGLPPAASAVVVIFEALAFEIDLLLFLVFSRTCLVVPGDDKVRLLRSELFDARSLFRAAALEVP